MANYAKALAPERAALKLNAGQHIHRWLWEHGEPATVEQIATGLGMTAVFVKGAIARHRQTFIIANHRHNNNVPALWWPVVAPGQRVQWLHKRPVFPPLMLSGVVEDVDPYRVQIAAHGETYEVCHWQIQAPRITSHSDKARIVVDWLLEHGAPACRNCIAAGTGMPPYTVTNILSYNPELFVKTGMFWQRRALWTVRK